MKTTIVQVPTPITNEMVDYVIIDHDNGEYTSMPKAVYDQQQVEHLTEIPTPPAE